MRAYLPVHTLTCYRLYLFLGSQLTQLGERLWFSGCIWSFLQKDNWLLTWMWVALTTHLLKLTWHLLTNRCLHDVLVVVLPVIIYQRGVIVWKNIRRIWKLLWIKNKLTWYLLDVVLKIILDLTGIIVLNNRSIKTRFEDTIGTFGIGSLILPHTGLVEPLLLLFHFYCYNNN